jgi:hypothetical protein
VRNRTLALAVMLDCRGHVHAGTTMASAAFLRSLDDLGRELRDEILSRLGLQPK